MRLIDKDKLFEVLNKKSVPFNANVNDAILTAPTIELIHCRDCEHYFRASHECSAHHWDVSQGCLYPEVYDDDYCSFGERKEDDER